MTSENPSDIKLEFYARLEEGEPITLQEAEEFLRRAMAANPGADYGCFDIYVAVVDQCRRDERARQSGA